MSEKPSSSNARSNPVTIAAWRAAVSDDSGKAFAELVQEDVVLEGSVFPQPIAGREAVRNAMRQSSRLYDRLEFTHETQSIDRAYFEWQGNTLGLPVWGVTAISLGVDGRVARVVLSHRPLDVVLGFSAALADRLAPPRRGARSTTVRLHLNDNVRALLRTFGTASRAMAAVIGEVAADPELRTAWRQGVTAALTDCVREIVERAVARGELPATSDIELLSMLPVTVLQSWRLEHGQSPDDATVERIVGQFYTPASTWNGAASWLARTLGLDP